MPAGVKEQRKGSDGMIWYDAMPVYCMGILSAAAKGKDCVSNLRWKPRSRCCSNPEWKECLKLKISLAVIEMRWDHNGDIPTW